MLRKGNIISISINKVDIIPWRHHYQNLKTQRSVLSSVQKIDNISKMIFLLLLLPYSRMSCIC